MDIAVQKKNYSFRFPIELMEKLRAIAKRHNRSVNNYLETMIMEEVALIPNETSLTAMEEARTGRNRRNPPLDLSSIEAMEKSMGL